MAICLDFACDFSEIYAVFSLKMGKILKKMHFGD